MTLTRAALALPFLVLLSGPADARDWPEPCGGPRNHNSTASFEAPRTAPVEKWRAKYDDVLGEPVVSGGVVYAAVRRKGSQRLVALDVETGEKLASIKFKAQSFAHVSVRGPMVVVVTSSRLFVFVRNEDGFVEAQAIRGAFRSPATLLPGIAAVFDSGKMKLVQLRSGEVLHQAPAVASKPVVVFGEDDSATVYFQEPVAANERLKIIGVRLDALTSPAPTVTVEDAADQFVPFSRDEQEARILLVTEGGSPLFLVGGDRTVRTLAKTSLPFFFAPSSGGEPSITSAPIVWGGALYGRSSTGALLLQEPPEAGRPILSRQKRPRGAVDGPITCARGVMLLGNYAMDLESRRVLWTVPGLPSVGPLVPAADGVVVFEDRDGDVVAYSNEKELVEAARAAAKAARAAEQAKIAQAKPKPKPEAKPGGKPGAKPGGKPGAKPGGKPGGKPTANPGGKPTAKPGGQPGVKPGPSPDGKPVAKPAPEPKPKPVAPAGPSFPSSLPGSGPAVVLNDGTRIPGVVQRLDGGRVRVTTKSGDRFNFGPRKICAIETAQGVEIVGVPYGLVIATQAGLDRALNEDLAAVVQNYAKRSLVIDARRLLAEVRRRGLDEDHVRDLEQQLVDKKEVDIGRSVQLAAGLREESDAREAAVERVLVSARWLVDASLPLEASAVLAGASRIWSAQEVPAAQRKIILEAAKPLVPTAFPWADVESAADRWLAWAPELAPSRARFAEEGEIPDLGAKGSTWTRRTYVLRTRNLVVATKSSDPLAIGPALSSGEAAVRALDVLLSNPPKGDERPLEARIHRSRDAYLNEDLGQGRKSNSRSMGSYSPSLKSSRFHVPSKRSRTDGGRGLPDVLARVLTHQYIAERWRAVDSLGLPAAQTPGFWIEVGFARFVEDQTLELGRSSVRLDDPAARSVEATAALAMNRELIGFESFLENTQARVVKMTDRPSATVRLGPDGVPITYSERSIYEEQAGAFVYFLVHERGAEGRTRFLELLREHYRGGTKRGAWKKLGFASVEEAERAFRDFLDSTREQE